jgi:hypothetical protein
MQTVCIDDDDLLTPELEAVEVKKVVIALAL